MQVRPTVSDTNIVSDHSVFLILNMMHKAAKPLVPLTSSFLVQLLWDVFQFCWQNYWTRRSV